METKHTPGLTYQRVVLFGADVLARLYAERDERVSRSKLPGREDCFASNELCRWQADVHMRGFRGAELVESIYGWSVRSNSGLENFMLIASSRCGQVNGSREDAERYAREWQSEQPTRRYVTVVEKARAAIAKAGAA